MMVSRLQHLLLISIMSIMLFVATTQVMKVPAAASLTPALQFVDGTGTPLAAGESVRVLCYESATTPELVDDIWVEIDDLGYPLTGTMPTNCAYIAALHRQHTQPAGKQDHGPAYWVYATSWSAGTTTPVAATGQVTLTHPLVLFNLVVSLAWEPEAGSPFLDDLEEGLVDASAYLYDITEGQMAFGPVVFHTGGRQWPQADLRFLAANDYRPSANIGGMMAAHTAYTASATLSKTVYAPGRIYLGRYWDGFGASNPITGSWNQPDATHTLIHEWNHYALFLYDEYQKTSTSAYSKGYCTCNGLPKVGSMPFVCRGATPETAASVMAYHYTASELWSRAIHGRVSTSCFQSQQFIFHGMSDWETLAEWGAIQGSSTEWLTAPSALTSGPVLGLTADLFGPSPGSSLREASTTTAPTVQVAIEANLPVSQAVSTQVYLLEGINPDFPDRIVYQGTAVGEAYLPEGQVGEITLLGVETADHARLFVDYYSETVGSRYVYPAVGPSAPPLTDGLTLVAAEKLWNPSLDVVYGMEDGRLVTMTAKIEPGGGLAPDVQLCVLDEMIGCREPKWQRTMVDEGDYWLATFTPLPGYSELPDYSLIRIKTTESEIVRWIQVAGGVGPGHKDAEAPLRDGLVMVDSPQPLTGKCNRVVIMPAANYQALQAPLPAGVQGILGIPLDIDVLLPGGTTCSSDNQSGLGAPLIFTLFYNQQDVDRFSFIKEGNLRLLHFVEGVQGSAWVDVTSNLGSHNTDLDWLTTVPLSQGGIYAIGWTP